MKPTPDTASRFLYPFPFSLSTVHTLSCSLFYPLLPSSPLCSPLLGISLSPSLFRPPSPLFHRGPPNRPVQMRAALSLYPRIKRIVYDKSWGWSLTKRPLARCKTRAGVYMRGMNSIDPLYYGCTKVHNAANKEIKVTHYSLTVLPCAQISNLKLRTRSRSRNLRFFIFESLYGWHRRWSLLRNPGDKRNLPSPFT